MFGAGGVGLVDEAELALLLCVVEDELLSFLEPPFKILSMERLSEIDSLRLPEEELELELESERDDSLSSSPPSQAPYINAHLESLITSWRLPFTRTASTVSGIFQLEA